MKKVSKLGVVFLSVLLLVASATTTWAQNPVTTNPGKSAGHISDTVQEKISKIEEKMKSLSQSKFAQTIGKGIQKAKDGMKFIQEKAKQAKTFINNTKKAILESKAYQAAMVAKEIAEEGKKIKEMEDEREQKIAAMKEENEVEKETLQAKLEEAQENCRSGLEIYEAELAEVSDATKEQTDQNAETGEVGNGSEVQEENQETEVSDGTKEAINQKIETYKASCESEIQEIEQKIKAIEDSVKKIEKDINIEFAKKIYDEKDKIIALTNKAKELKGKKEKKEEKTPQEEADETTELFIDKGPVSLKTAADNRKRRIKKLQEAFLNSMNTAAEKVNQTEETKEAQEMETESSETMDGTSESVHVATENLANQLDRLAEVLEGDLQNILTTTYNTMATMQMRSDVDRSTMVDMCNYTKQGCPASGIGGLVSTVTSTVSSVKDKVADVQSKISEATQVAAEAQNIVKDVKEKASVASDLVTNVKDAAGSVSETDFSLNSML